MQLAGVLALAILVRARFFVGFGLGDDLTYVGHADLILSGGYPPLDPLNQYAYRPLLLLLFAGGIALFGHTDFGVVAPVFFASLVTTTLIYLFVRRLIDARAAVWCAVLFAFEPFNVVNSTTMTNDVILSCLVFASVALFLLADLGDATSRQLTLRFLAAGAVMFAAFLVKITVAPVLMAIALYSLIACRRRASFVLRYHSVFYLAFLTGVAASGAAYWLLTGDPLWQFKAETFYYETYKPDWYLAGAIDYWGLMSQYPRSLFGISGVPGHAYRDHGLLFWALVPATVVMLRRGTRVMGLLLLVALCVFLFFQFYPQYLHPWYLPLVRQDRYLEMLLPAVVIVVGTFLWDVSRTRPLVAVAVLSVLVVDFVAQGARRAYHFRDSQEDMRVLAQYARDTVRRTGRPLAVDMPAHTALQFYLRDSPVATRPVSAPESQAMPDSYVVAGGSRSYWWSSHLIFDVRPESPPPGWVLTYEHPAAPRPWRQSNLRVYYVSDFAANVPLFDAAGAEPAALTPGLLMTAYDAGFDEPGVAVAIGGFVPDIDHRVPLPAPRLQWDGWMRAESGAYTFETTSDDGSWVTLNGKSVLDNGGTHPARTVSRTVRLAAGWYSFRLRYEDTGGDRLLRFRVYKDYRRQPVDPSALFFSTLQTPQR